MIQLGKAPPRLALRLQLAPLGRPLDDGRLERFGPFHAVLVLPRIRGTPVTHDADRIDAVRTEAERPQQACSKHGALDLPVGRAVPDFHDVTARDGTLELARGST